MNKVCTRCGVDKPLEKFAKRNDRASGYRSTCKECDNDYTKAYREENKNKYMTSLNNWRIINRDKYLKNKRDHEKKQRTSNPEYAERVKSKNSAYAKTAAGKATQKRWIRNGYDIGDDVMYMHQKYKILEIIPRKGYRIRKYGLEGTILIRPRRVLEKKKKPTLL